ncbi:MAG TPA: MBL fold metallo-hydrolase [Caldilinea sp.]|nr:MBL fold metallo-hydrolase [Caldilinea sp.]
MAHLAVEILGSGGAVRTPRPGCTCDLCANARQIGIPWARTGPSIFVHGPNVLIDTPEDSCYQVDRANLPHIAAGLYSHWHPDHTSGRRMWETRNADFRHWPPHSTNTPIYIAPNVWRDFEQTGIAEAFRYKEARGYVTVHVSDAPLDLGGWRITAHALAETYVNAFLLEELDGSRRVLIAMDELFGWTPPAALCGVDLAVLPKGLFDTHPFSGQRLIPVEHPILRSEATWEQTLAMVDRLAPARTVFMHIEEPESFTPDDYGQLAAQLRTKRGWDVTFAYDTLVIEL